MEKSAPISLFETERICRGNWLHGHYSFNYGLSANSAASSALLILVTAIGCAFLWACSCRSMLIQIKRQELA